MDKLIIAGNLGSDPEMKYLNDETAVTNFSMAANRVWYDKNGEKVEQTVWYRIAAWGKQAESCNTYLKKGSYVIVEGQLTPDDKGNPRIWADKEGIARASYEVRATRVEFGPKKTNGAGGSSEEIPFDMPVEEVAV
jgi:single-strand DNA-binding protein